MCPDDFLYIERIGEGGFGRVVHVKKKSTQSHYAMKIQLKTALLDTFNDDPTRIDHERWVMLLTFRLPRLPPFVTSVSCSMHDDLISKTTLLLRVLPRALNRKLLCSQRTVC